MSGNYSKKDHGPVDMAREQSGLYKLGFDMDSMKGFMLPFIAIMVLGGLGVALILWL